MGQKVSTQATDAQILMLGLDAAGKSTLLYKLKHNEAVCTVPTIGFNVEMIEMKKMPKVLTVWDVGGQENMRPYWKHYYQDMAGIMYVVDSSDWARLGEARKELIQILRSSLLEGLPLVILANKQDVDGTASVTEITQNFGLSRTCSNRNWFVQPCSARTGAGVEEGFRMMAYLIKISSESSFKGAVNYLRSMSTTS